MAKVVDPDQLNQDYEVTFDTVNKEIYLAEAGVLDNSSPGKTSGVTMQALYSFGKQEWMTDADLNKFKFPLKALTKFKFDWQNAWAPSSDSSGDLTRDLLRDAGWKEVSGREYACIISLGDIDAPQADQAYLQQVAGFDQTAIEYDAYRMPLYNETDINVLTADATIDSDPPYTNMTIDFLVGNLFETWAITTQYTTDDVVQGSDGRWYICQVSASLAEDPATAGASSDWVSYVGEREIGTGNWYAFNRIIEATDDSSAATAGTLTQIYEFERRSLRKLTDINDDVAGDGFGTVYGNVAKEMLGFVGTTLATLPGVFIDNYNINDQNDMEFYDITVDSGGLDAEYVPLVSTKRTFPFVAAGTMNFSANLVGAGKYWMYFNDAGGSQYDSAAAILVDDNGGTDITGTIGGAAIVFDFDYTGNNQGGRTPNEDADIWIVAMDLENAEWIATQFIITKATGLTFNVNASDERAYYNPS